MVAKTALADITATGGCQTVGFCFDRDGVPAMIPFHLGGDFLTGPRGVNEFPDISLRFDTWPERPTLSQCRLDYLYIGCGHGLLLNLRRISRCFGRIAPFAFFRGLGSSCLR